MLPHTCCCSHHDKEVNPEESKKNFASWDFLYFSQEKKPAGELEF